MPDVLTVREAAAFLRCSPATVRRRVRAGKLPASKSGRRWRFRRADLERCVARLSSGDMTDLVVSNPRLVADIRAAEREARQGRFLSWEDAFEE
jgi:excisionase family DNA binding protein